MLDFEVAPLRCTTLGLALGLLGPACGDATEPPCPDTHCPGPLAPVADDTSDPARDLGAAAEDSLPLPEARAAFIDIEAIEYEDALGAQRSQPARLFYSLLPAAQDAKEKPVFVFFNGGPGYNTTAELHAFGTGPMTVAVDPPRAEAVPNPDSFDQLGSLLYIDARNTGFSHLVADNPAEEAQRLAGVTHASQNEWLDAADFARVILRVLEREPVLRNNRVILIGESYGASRAAMLRALLFAPQRLETGATDELVPYVDPALADELRAHYALVFPDLSFTDLDIEVLSQQFGRQVLVQPAFGMAASERRVGQAFDALFDCSPGSPMSKAAALRGAMCPLPYEAFDPEHLEKPPGYFEQVLDAGILSTLDPDGFALRFGVAPSEVLGLSASQRAGAFRYGELSNAQVPLFESERWQGEQGALPEWDRYFLQTFPEAGGFRGELEPLRVAFRLFLRQLPWVQTLITDAFFDLDVPSRDLSKVIEEWQRTEGLDLTVQHDATPRTGELRSGWLGFEYGPAFDVPDTRRRPQVRMPLYEHSAHMVTVTEGAELMHDVRDFFFTAAPDGD